MGFNLPGKSIHRGTSAHSSALKYKQEQDAAAKFRAQQEAASPVETGGAEVGSSPAKSKGKLLQKIITKGDDIYQGVKKTITKTKTKTKPKGKANPPKSSKTPKKTPKKTTPKATDKLKNLDKVRGTSTRSSMVAKLKKWGLRGLGAYSLVELGRFINKMGSDKSGQPTDVSEDGTGQKTIMRKVVKKKRRTTSGDSGAYAKAKKVNPELDSLIAERKKHAKGSDEYNKIQNRINVAYGSSKRHGVEKDISTRGRKTTRTTYTPGISTKTVTGKKRRSGKLKKRVTDIDRDEGYGRDRRVVEKYRRSGARRKTVEKYDAGTGQQGQSISKEKVKTKYRRSGDVKKKVTVKDGKRTVTKTNRRGKTTTRTRKTLNPFD